MSYHWLRSLANAVHAASARWTELTKALRHGSAFGSTRRKPWRKRARPRCEMVQVVERRVLLSGTSLAADVPGNIEGNLADLYRALQPARGSAARNSMGTSSSNTMTESDAAALRELIRFDASDRPIVDVWTQGGTADVAAQLAALGATIYATSDQYRVVEAGLDLADLVTVAGMAGVLSVTPVYRPLAHAGIVQTQGDAVLNADDVRLAGVDGTSIMVGVLSDSAFHIEYSQATGDLPDTVDRYLEFPADDEGRAMLEIVHDIAPGARLAHHSGLLSELSFAQGIRELAAAGSDVIVDDLIYFTEPFFQDGIVAQAVNDVTADGVVYVSAAGNFADFSYESNFNASGALHDFDASAGIDTRQQVTIASGYGATLILQWDDPFYTTSGVTHDFNVRIYDGAGNVIKSGLTSNVSTQKPIEVVQWTGSGSGVYQIEIERVAGSGPSFLKYILVTSTSTGSINEYATHSSTVFGHAAAAGAIAVGAVPFYSPDTIEPFSSRGDVTIFFDAQGNRLSTPEVRHKPDVVAPDNVNTTNFGIDIPQDADTRPNFAGTSAAAPHVAAVAALLLDANPHMTRQQVTEALTSTAIDLGAPGRDSIYGFGRVDAEAARLAAIAMPDVTAPSAELLTPIGTHGWSVNSVQVRFSEALNPAATDAANYRVVGAGSDQTFDTQDDVSYGVTVAWDAERRISTLTFTTPGAALPVGLYRLTLDATDGLADPSGNALNGGTDQAIDFTVSTRSDVIDVEQASQIALRPNGSSVMVYPNNPSVGLIWPQVMIGQFDAGGRARGPFVTAPTDMMYSVLVVSPDVAVTNGSGVIVFADRVGSPHDNVPSLWQVGCQLLDADGRPVGTWQIVGFAYSQTTPRVKMSADGGFTVTYAGRVLNPGSGQYDTYVINARRYDALGTPLGSAFTVNQQTDSAIDPSVDVTANSDLLFTWAASQGVFARRFDASGTPLGDAFLVASVSGGSSTIRPEISAAADGSFVIAWTAPDGIYRRRFDANGVALEAPTRVFLRGTGAQLAVAADGRFVVAWESPDGGSDGIYAQRFAADGEFLGDRIAINAGTTGDQSAPRLAIRDNGDFLVTWTDTAGSRARWISWSVPDDATPIGPWVRSITPVGAAEAALHSVVLQFSEAIDLATLTAADIILKDPQGVAIAFTISEVQGSGHTRFTLDFAERTLRGDYRLQIGPDVRDLSGNPMDQDGDAIIGEATDFLSTTFSIAATVWSPAAGGPVLYQEDFENWDAGVPSYWRFQSAQVGTIVASGAETPYLGGRHLFFDNDGPSGSHPSMSATLGVDLSSVTGQTDLWLDFWAKQSDGGGTAFVDLSTDGVIWKQIWTASLSTSYGHISLDLDNLAQSNSVALDSDVFVRFRDSAGSLSSNRNDFFDNIRIRTGAANNAPTLTSVNTFAGATEETPYSMTFASLAAAADEADANGNPLTFRIESFFGTLTKDGVPVVAGVTMFSTGETLLWNPPLNASGLTTAFTVRAFDGDLVSGTSIPVRIFLTGVNDAPILDISGDPQLTAVAEDTASPPGSTVASFVGTSISDADPTPLKGIAVTGLTGTGSGTWQYSIDGGSSWSAFGTTSEASARLLYDTFRIRFVPAGNFNGTVTLTYRAWDRTSGSFLTPANLTGVGATGGTTAFSTASETATLTVTPVNDPPTGLSLSVAAVAENQPSGTTVGDFSTSDVDTVDTYTYALVAGTGSTDNGSFSISGNSLVTAAEFDFETKNSYSIRVEVTDAGGAKFERTFTINVSNVNEAPTAINLTNTTTILPEDASTEGRIALADIHVVDDALGSETFALTGTDAAFFEIDTGVLYLKAGTALDYEAKSSYSVTVTVDDNTVGAAPDASIAFTLTISDVNEAPTAVNLANTTTTLAENTSTVSRIAVADIHVVDDALGSETLALTGTDAAFFEIDAGVLYLKAGTTLDFESRSSYAVTVTVDDGTVGSAPDASVGFTLTITDVNEAPTGVSLSETTTSLPENTNMSARIRLADISAVDDALGSEAFGLTGADAAFFEIDSGTLYLKAGTLLDYESKGQYTVGITADDASVGSTPDASILFSLTITDVNEAPAAVSLENAILTLSESTSTSLPIRLADIVVTDDALGDEAITLGGLDAAAFEILSGSLYLRAGVTLNYEAKPSYSVTIRIDDSTFGGDPDATVDFTLSVLDENEAPTAVALTDATTTLPENTSTAERIRLADILVTDDALGSEILSLAGADAAFFEIDGGVLYLRSGTTLNFETKPSYAVTVRVDDPTVGAAPDVTVDFTLTILDVNEAPTAVTLGNTTTTLSENTLTVDRIRLADILVTDDALGSETLALTGTDAAFFEIDAGSLYLKAGTSLDFEAKSSYSVTVTVDDNTVGAAPDASIAFTLTITDVNEASTAVNLANVTTTLDENTSTVSRIQVADIHVVDDALGSETLALTGTDAVFFEIDAGVLYLKAGTSLDFEAKNSYAVTVTADDATVGSSPDASASYSLSITDVNEAPTVTLTNTTTAMVENSNPATRLKVADISIADDALGTNVLSLSGADVGFFEIDSGSLFLRGGMRLDFETNPVLDVTVEVNDASVGTSPDSAALLAIQLSNVSEAATTIAGFSGSLTFKENSAPVVLAASVTVTDPDSPNYAFGILTLRITQNGEAGDRLAIRHQGNGAGQIGVAGNAVSFGAAANVIGTFTGGDGVNPLVVNLTAACTQAALKALIQNLTYADLADVPLTAAKRIELTIGGGDGMLSAVSFKTVTVTPTNDVSTIGAFLSTAPFVEAAGPVLVSANATVADPDSANFDTGKLTIRISANGHADDRLTLRNQGNGAGQVGVQTVGTVTNVTFGGVLIGTLTGGTVTVPLVVTFKAAADAAAVQAVLRNVLFSNVSTNPTTLSRTLQATLTDGDGGTSATVSTNIAVQPVNTASTVVLGGNITYTRTGPAALISSTGTVTDPDSTNFNGGRLVVEITGNADATDQLRVVHQGTAAGKIGVAGNVITFGGVNNVIGTFSGGDGGMPLTIVFTTNAAMPAAVQALLRDITFGSGSTTPSPLPRTLRVTLDDGDGATSAPATKTISIVHNTSLAGWDGSVAYVENAAPVVLDTAVTLTDPDTTSFADFLLTATLTANASGNDRLGIRNQGTATGQIGFDGTNIRFQGTTIGTATGGTGSTPLTIALNAAATQTAVKSLIQNLTFSNVSDAPSTLPRTVTLVVTDPAGYANPAVAKTVTLTAVNDAPVIGSFASPVNYSGAPVLVAAGATVSDADRVDFATGKLTVQLTNNAQTTDRLQIRATGTGADEIRVTGTVVTYGGTAIGTVTGGSELTALVITFNSNASEAAVQALLRSIEFTSTSSTPSRLTRTIRATLTDGDGGTSNMPTNTITVL